MIAMSDVALGFRVHSGWAAMVAVARQGRAFEVIDRRIVTVIDDKMAGAKQPFHYVEEMDLRTAETHLARCAKIADRMARDALQAAARGRDIVSASILTASGRPLPALYRILASHALIHAAEGEFFRDVFRRALTNAGISAVDIRERDVTAAASLRRPPNPPWAQDQKLAAYAACRLLL